MTIKCVVFLLFVVYLPCIIYAQSDYPVGNLSNSWINNDSNPKGSITFADGSMIRPVLLNNSNPVSFPAVGCGFYGNRTTNSFFFTVFAVQATSDSTIVGAISPEILWTANRANPVKENATLKFNGDGNLVLSDANGTSVWSSNTSNKSINQMNVSGNGTLQLVRLYILDSFSEIIWESWDLPTDTWLHNQILHPGQRLVSSISVSNLQQGSFYLAFENKNLHAFIESDPPQMYSQIILTGIEKKQFKTGRLDVVRSTNDISVAYVSETDNFQYLRFDPNGHLRAYRWVQGQVSEVDDVLTDKLGNCAYPTVCGNYGICSNGNCDCPVGNDGASYFTKLSLGCRETTQLSCQSSHLHSFIEIDSVSYFGFVTVHSNINLESCRQACLNNCSCKAAIFHYSTSTSNGNCSLPSQIFSLMSSPQGLVPYNSTSFIKVQRSSLVSPSPPSVAVLPSPNDHSTPKPLRNKSRNRLVVGLVLAAAAMTIFLILVCVRRIRKQRSIKDNIDEEWENSLLRATDMPKRYTHQDLKSATDNFHKKLGGGGFGSVFEGTLIDGMKIAVKRLDRFVQKSFWQRLLVYECMSNGSLDKWIFNRNHDNALKWKIRKKIILSIAKGLAYLHEDCERRIAHLDIKPQNILVDEKFNAKLSDFGLAKLLDRNESQVTTQMRGTRGYMAPEWLSRKITEKVDVYSFGVVILEIVCGRRNLDLSPHCNEEDHFLLAIVKRKAEENRLIDLVDKCGEGMQENVEEAVEMIRLAIWCLNNDATRRPTMSIVVKVLDGVMAMEWQSISDFSFLGYNVVEVPNEVAEVIMVPSDPQPASILSGPRS